MWMTFAFLQNLGGFEMVLICVVALIVFGNKFPEVARNFGKAFQQFKSGIQEAGNHVRRELEQAADEADPTPEIKSAIGDDINDGQAVPDDYASNDHPPAYPPPDPDHAMNPDASGAEATASCPDGTQAEADATAGSTETSQSEITGNEGPSGVPAAEGSAAPGAQVDAASASAATVASGSEAAEAAPAAVPASSDDTASTEGVPAAAAEPFPPPGTTPATPTEGDVKPAARNHPDAALLN